MKSSPRAETADLSLYDGTVASVAVNHIETIEAPRGCYDRPDSASEKESSFVHRASNIVKHVFTPCQREKKTLLSASGLWAPLEGCRIRSM